MSERSPRRGRTYLAVPLVLVNLSAVWGQAGWAFDHITRGGVAGTTLALLFALAVESIGVYLAWESHESLMADQASAFLRFGSYAVGILVGVLNFAHFSGQSFAAGVAFGALSAISPWLWGIWSRARNRARLAELGLVDVRGVKLSTARKFWHPVRSVRVLSWAAWTGVTDPAEAVSGWQAYRCDPNWTPSDPPSARENIQAEELSESPRSGAAGTDETLADQVVRWASGEDGMPSRERIRLRYGIGSKRAERIRALAAETLELAQSDRGLTGV